MEESETFKIFLIVCIVVLVLFLAISRFIRYKQKVVVVPVQPSPKDVVSKMVFTVPGAEVPTLSIPIDMAPPAINNLNRPRMDYTSIGVGGGYYYDQGSGTFKKW